MCELKLADADLVQHGKTKIRRILEGFSCISFPVIISTKMNYNGCNASSHAGVTAKGISDSTKKISDFRTSTFSDCSLRKHSVQNRKRNGNNNNFAWTIIPEHGTRASDSRIACALKHYNQSPYAQQ